MSRAFTAIQVTRDEAQRARDFVLASLRKDPNDRPTAEALQLHPFLRADDSSRQFGDRNLPMLSKGQEYENPLPIHEDGDDILTRPDVPHVEITAKTCSMSSDTTVPISKSEH